MTYGDWTDDEMEDADKPNDEDDERGVLLGIADETAAEQLAVDEIMA